MNPLTHTTAITTGLLDASGNPTPVSTVNILALPLIDRRALPGLPRDMEARLMGDDTIVLFHPESELHIEMPLLERKKIAEYVARIAETIERQAMGEGPESDGYRVA